MLTLGEILERHDSVLVLDSASSRVQVGLLGQRRAFRWQGAPGEAGQVLFAETAALLQNAGTTLDQVDAFVFCEGPGSMLGIRTTAMASRTWTVLKPRPVYSYQSLAVAARFAWSSGGPRALAVVADARRDTWHCQSIDAAGRLEPLRRLTPEALPDVELFTPEHFRAWAPPPRRLETCSYDLARMLPAVSDCKLFSPAPAPDAFQHEAPEYRKWSATIHRAPTASSK